MTTIRSRAAARRALLGTGKHAGPSRPTPATTEPRHRAPAKS